ncbi:hypothetical protein HDF18_00625 [Mucilaginibacter sp. X5P1]|nr:hypothetical protein [Mucilaginibacter sp. X5P1]MBB6138399.1 hypothetical protein [Mucilaginibacter sp. X5P1]
MKKILLAVTIIFSAGILSLNTKVSHVQPVSAIHISYFEYKKELANGD